MVKRLLPGGSGVSARNGLMEEQPEIVIAVMQVGGTYPCLTCLYPFHATYFVVDVYDPAHDLNLDTSMHLLDIPSAQRSGLVSDHHRNVR